MFLLVCALYLYEKETTMKSTIKLLLCVILLTSSCSSLPKSERDQEFIVLKTKDTIVANELKAVNPFRNIGRVTITNDGIETAYSYDEIYQIHYVDRKNRPYVVEIIEEDPSFLYTHVEMDIVINQGKVRLYKNDPGFRPDYPFVVSDFYHGYVNRNSQRKQLLENLDKCEAFRTKFTEKEQRREKHLEAMIRFYNANCEHVSNAHK